MSRRLWPLASRVRRFNFNAPDTVTALHCGQLAVEHAYVSEEIINEPPNRFIMFGATASLHITNDDYSMMASTLAMQSSKVIAVAGDEYALEPYRQFENLRVFDPVPTRIGAEGTKRDDIVADGVEIAADFLRNVFVR